MRLKGTIIFTVVLYFLGLAIYLFRNNGDEAIWFALGGGLALLNLFFAAFAVRLGLKSVKSTAIFFGMIFLKTITFFLSVAAVLIFLKPLLLPFTLGLGVVIFGACSAALVATRRLVQPAERDEIGTKF